MSLTLIHRFGLALLLTIGPAAGHAVTRNVAAQDAAGPRPTGSDQTSAQSTDRPTDQPPWAAAYHPRPVPDDAATLPVEMAELFEAMGKAAAESAEVFRPLSAAQLDHQPADGTHTPRWNAEHMAGAQVLFFSQLFHAADADIPVIAAMPQQMPKDYQAVHPGRDGQSVADWIIASDAYCRRYAYLLADKDLDAEISVGPFRSLRALLTTMVRHYDEHTGNVKKKMEAADWPR